MDEICSAIKTFYDDVNTITGFGPICVVSQVVGVAKIVTSVEVDSEVDIQRRRAGSQTELRLRQYPVLQNGG